MKHEPVHGAPSENRRLAYVTLQATSEGQAAHAHVHEIIAGVRALGWDVDLYQPGYGPNGSPSVVERLRQFAMVQGRLLRRIDAYDAIYIRAHALAYPTTLAAWIRSKPSVQECNGPYSDLFTAWPVARLVERPLVAAQRHQYRMATRNIVVTDGLKKWVDREAGRDDSAVVPNGANVHLFRPDAPRPAGLPPRYVVFFGALAVWQGLATVLEACSSPSWPEDVELVVVGDGVMRKEVEAAAGQNRRISFLGRQPYRMVPGIVANSLASLSVQDDEGRATTGLSPLKVYESMACGVPTIVSDRPGLVELIEGSSAGIVIPASDPRALAGAVAELSADPARTERMGRAGREAVVSNHCWEARASDVAQILNTLMLNGWRHGPGRPEVASA